MSSKQFHQFKDFSICLKTEKSLQKFAAHYACGNADLNLILVVAATVKGFILQINNYN